MDNDLLIDFEEESEESEDDLRSTATEDEIAILIDDATQTQENINLGYSLWKPSTPGKTSEKIALHCFFSETEGKELHEIPSILFITASQGNSHYFILPEDFTSFLKFHKNSIFIFYDNAKQSIALGKLIEESEDENLFDFWWELIENNSVKDCMILDSLIRYIFCFFSLSWIDFNKIL